MDVLDGWEWDIAQAWLDLRGNDYRPALGLPLGKGIGEHGAAFVAYLRHAVSFGATYLIEMEKRHREHE